MQNLKLIIIPAASRYTDLDWIHHWPKIKLQCTRLILLALCKGTNILVKNIIGKVINFHKFYIYVCMPTCNGYENVLLWYILDHYIVCHPYLCIDSEKLEESTHGTIFTGGTHFGKTGSKTFRSFLRHEAKFFGGKTLSLWCSTIPCYSTQRYFQWHKKHVNRCFVCKSYATEKLTFFFSHL